MRASRINCQSAIASYSSILHRLSFLSRQSAIVSQSSVLHRLSFLSCSPPSSLSHQSSIACQYSVVSPSLSYSRQSAIVSQFSGDSSSLYRSPVCTACQSNQPTAFSLLKSNFGEARPVFRSFQTAWIKKWPCIHYDQVNDKTFCFTCVKASKLGNFEVCAIREMMFF